MNSRTAKLIKRASQAFATSHFVDLKEAKRSWNAATSAEKPGIRQRLRRHLKQQNKS